MKPRRARKRERSIAFLLVALVVTSTTSMITFAGKPQQQLANGDKAPAAQTRSPRFWLSFAVSSHPSFDANDDITGGMIHGLPLPGLQFGANVLPWLSLNLTVSTIGVFNAAAVQARAYPFPWSSPPYIWAGASGGLSTSLLEQEIGDLASVGGGLGAEFARHSHFFASFEYGVEALFTQGGTLLSVPIRFAIGGRF